MLTEGAALGFWQLVHEMPVAGAQEYEVPPPPLNCVESPWQIALGFAEAVGLMAGTTVTVTVAVAVQFPGPVPVTV